MGDLGTEIYDLLTAGYNDKIDITKDMNDCLIDKKKADLMGIYLYYSYAANEIYAESNTIRLKNKSKIDIVNTIQTIIEKNFIEILRFFSKEEINNLRHIAKKNENFRFYKKRNNNISLNSINLFKNLGLIFCKKDGDDIVIHMPEYIRNKVNAIIDNTYSGSYKSILELSEGLVGMYGAIDIERAYMILKEYILVDYSKYISIIKLSSALELNGIYYSLVKGAMYNMCLDEDEIDDIINIERIALYNKDEYLLMAKEDEGFLESLNEYKKFKNFMLNNYKCDINEDWMIKTELINAYIDKYQIDEKKAKKELHNKILEIFDVNEYQEIEITSYIEEIRKQFPIWNKGRNNK